MSNTGNSWTNNSGNNSGNNSFNRFDDDLSEVLITYLSIEDKFRFECLSKQWQRLVFNKEKQLTIDFRSDDQKLFTKDNNWVINSTKLESILKKWSNLTAIHLLNDIENKEEVFQLILKYVKHLTKITANFADLSETTLKQFCHKFGSDLKSLKLSSVKGESKDILRFCPNIEVLDFSYRFSDIFGENEILLKRLKKICFRFTSCDEKSLHLFVDNYKYTLKTLKVRHSAKTSQEVNGLIGEIARLPKLNRLVILQSNESVDNSFVEQFSKIGENCRQLSSLEIQLNMNSSDVKYNLFKALNKFESLEKLNLSLISTLESKPFVLTSKMLNKNLTHLTIDGFVCKGIPFDDQFFADIDKYLPKLQDLSLDCLDITDKTFESLSKLSDLSCIQFCGMTDTLISKSVVMEVIRKCLKLNDIHFNNYRIAIHLIAGDIKLLRRKGLSECNVRVVAYNYEH